MAKQTVQVQIESALVKSGFEHLPTVTKHTRMVKNHYAGNQYNESVYIQSRHIKCKVTKGTEAYTIIKRIMKRKPDMRHTCGTLASYVSWEL